jgi:hypothetical protein
VDHVAQPRYLVLNHDQLFTGEKGVGVHEVLDGGISVLEVHTHDYVLILEDEDLNKKYVKLFTGIGRVDRDPSWATSWIRPCTFFCAATTRKT